MPTRKGSRRRHRTSPEEATSASNSSNLFTFQQFLSELAGSRTEDTDSDRDFVRDYRSAVVAHNVVLAAITLGYHDSVYSCLLKYRDQLDRFNLLEPALRWALEQHQLECAVSIMKGMEESHWMCVVVECVRAGSITLNETHKLLQRKDIHLYSRLSLAILLGETDYVVSVATSASRFRLTPDKWSRVLMFTYIKGNVDLARQLQQHVRLTVDEGLLAIACTPSDTDFVTQVATGHKDTDAQVDWDNIMFRACLLGHGDLITAIARHRQLKNIDGELVLAYAAGDLPAMQRRLTDSMIGENWYHCLIAACLAGHAHVCDVLMEYVQQAGLDVGAVVRAMKFTTQGIQILYNKPINSSTIQYIQSKMKQEFTPDLTWLHRSCYKGESATIHTYTALHTTFLQDINTTGYYGFSLLHVTVLGHNDNVEKIVNEVSHIMPAFSDVTKQKLTKPSAASLDKLNERVRIVDFLLHHGATVDCTDKEKRTPLHLAAISGGLDVIPKLLNAKADIDARDSDCMTPVAYCSQKGHHRLLKYLVERKCNVTITNINNETPLHHASQHNHIQCVELLALHPELIDCQDCDGSSALSLACSAGHSKVVDVLIQHKANPQIPNKDGRVVVHMAAIHGSDVVLDKLIQIKVNLNLQDITGSTALHLAISNRRWKAATKLLKAGCKVNIANNLGNIPFQNACIWEQPSINSKFLKFLLSYKAEINHKNHSGESALMQATNMLDTHLMTYLVGHGADLKTTDNLGRGLIHTAVTSSYHSSQLRQLMAKAQNNKELIPHGKHSEIIIHNENQITEFSVAGQHTNINIQQILPTVASSAFNTSVVQFLLSKKLNVNAADINNQTALHLAASSGNLMATIFLLEKGAEFTTKDKFGFTPLMLALPHDEVFRMLWDKSLLNMTEDQFKKLRFLAHWHNRDDVKGKCESYIPILKDLKLQPQDFIQPNWSCNKSFSNWWNENTNQEFNGFEEFQQAWISSLQTLTYVNHQKIIKTLQSLIEDVLMEVATLDPLMGCMFRLSGSEREGAKVIATNEIDSLCVMLAITFDKFHLPTEASHHVLKEFVKLKCKDEYREELKRVLDSNGYLSRSKLFQNYGAALSKILADPKLWAKYPSLQRISKMDITGSIATITPLMVRWHDDVYAHLDVSIDMVPAIDVLDWRPSWANEHGLLDKLQTLIVPKWKTTAVDDDNMMEVGVSHWGEVFEQMPGSMVQGYRLAKVVKELCPQITDWGLLYVDNLITSYMLKMTIVKVYAGTLDTPNQHTQQYNDLHWAREIYISLEGAFRKQHLESFFIPTYNLLYDDKFAANREAAMAYCQLCLKLLMPETASHMRKAYMGIKEDDVRESHEASL